MKTNPPRTGAPYRAFLASLAPHLRRLAAAAPVYFKLIDFVPVSLWPPGGALSRNGAFWSYL